MSSRALRTSAAVVLVLVVLPVATAAAGEPKYGFRIGFGIAAGLPLNDASGGARGTFNPEQVGFQGSVGVSLPKGAYLGFEALPFLGQKQGGNQYMTQMFLFDGGWAFAVDSRISIRPMIGIGVNRYGIRPRVPPSASDRGFLLSPGLDVLVDLMPRFWIGAGFRMSFAFMGRRAGDLSFSSGGTDVSMQYLLLSGVRF